MNKPENLIGKKFDRLTVIKLIGKNKHKQFIWECLCNCGNKTIVNTYRLKAGKVKSCGCLRTETTIKRSLKHGHNKRNKRSKTYATWAHMIQRCFDKNCKEYEYYGKRKITVCNRWNPKKGGSFENFLKDMGECPGKGYSLDKINNDGDYYEKNCHWATNKQQQRNTRRNINIAFNGKTQCLAAWAEEYKIKWSTLWCRLYRYGWSIKEALTIPIRLRK